MKEIKEILYVDRLHIPIWKGTKKPLAIALSRAGRGWWGETMGAMYIMYNINLMGSISPIEIIQPNKNKK
jgi:hypothetical protein